MNLEMQHSKQQAGQQKTPFDLFGKWYDQAIEQEINDPNAMNLSTVSPNLQPNSRMVLMKNFDPGGFVFNTNLQSKKSEIIRTNALVALNFHWKSLHKQVRIEGKAVLISDKEANDCFAERPHEHQVAAWASKQSKRLHHGDAGNAWDSSGLRVHWRENLNKRVDRFNTIFSHQPMRRPSYWGGYRVIPNYFEFFQDVQFRLHDRMVYEKNGQDWETYSLYP